MVQTKYFKCWINFQKKAHKKVRLKILKYKKVQKATKE